MPTSRRKPAAPAPPDPANVPSGVPYTLYFPRRGGYAVADIAHAAPLPRVGDTVEYIGADGGRRRFTVREVVHTVQEQPEGGSGIPLLGAGLPAVYLARARKRPRV